MNMLLRSQNCDITFTLFVLRITNYLNFFNNTGKLTLMKQNFDDAIKNESTYKTYSAILTRKNI